MTVYILCPRSSGGVHSASRDLQRSGHVGPANLIVGWRNILFFCFTKFKLRKDLLVILSLEAVFVSIFFKKSVFWMHGFPNRSDMGLFKYLAIVFYYRFGCIFCWRCVAVSFIVKEVVSAIFGRKDIYVSHNCYGEFSRSIAAHQGLISIVYAGRLIEKKKVLDIVSCVECLNGDGIDIKLNVYGEGPLKSQLETKIKCSTSDAVVFHGRVSREKVLEDMRSAQIHVLPSVFEPCAMSVVESAELGLAQVLHRFSGAAEFVEPCFLIQEPTSLLSALMRAIQAVRSGYTIKGTPTNQWDIVLNDMYSK